MAWAMALLGAGAAAVLPPGLLSGLHTPLAQTGSVGQLQAQIGDLQARLSELKAGNTVLMQRAALADQSTSDVLKRLGALELTVPELIEAANAAPATIDSGIITGSTAAAPPTLQPAEGGSVSYSTTPLPLVQTAPEPASLQPLPSVIAPARPDPDAFGVALGPPILESEGTQAWQVMNGRAGTLLLGLSPLIAPIEGAPGHRLIAGPLSSEASARALCGAFAKLGIACASTAYMGTTLADSSEHPW